jgi:hypothetical protein
MNRLNAVPVPALGVAGKAGGDVFDLVIGGGDGGEEGVLDEACILPWVEKGLMMVML